MIESHFQIKEISSSEGKITTRKDNKKEDMELIINQKDKEKEKRRKLSLRK